MTIQQTDKPHSDFWNELCGNWLARNLGIEDYNLESLKRYDSAYLDLYPYLLKRVDLESMAGKRVLEVGLGHGTLGQKIAESAADYIGLDFALMPVKMMKYRLQLSGLSGQSILGSMLACPFQDESIDFFVSIGCFHHTGDVTRCADEAFRILKPGGKAFIMIYNQFSYRQWIRWPRSTFLALLRDHNIQDSKNTDVSEKQRRVYDESLSGNAAPETIFLSIRQLQRIFRKYSFVTFERENCGESRLLRILGLTRKRLLPIVGKRFGLDIYITATK